MIKNFQQILQKVRNQGTKKVAVAVAQDKHVLEAIKDAKKEGITDAILVGDKAKIKCIAAELDMDLNKFELIDEINPSKAALKAVELVSIGKADMVMKGFIDTARFLRAVLNKEIGLRTGKLMSHVGVFEIPNFNRLIFLTDVAFNMYPELKDKVDIVKNAVTVANAIGVEKPKVAPICAVEVVNPNMQATLDASVLSKMNNRGQIKGCIIDGPLALDNALSEEAASHKGIISEVAGKADVLLMPNIEAGNIMYKTLTYTTNCKNGGILVGTTAPVILTSRSDSHETKINSIALAASVANEINKDKLNEVRRNCNAI
ncbi:phosphate butyryltransferase [Clostridium luticellarii]|uniref:phosphate butyryltransferase n=1 Tax=Clostridium luticellarii TaxID=1691940 RepID=UPI0023574474|nr:phosphate butyryltransferase [Clostridium luticellarii]MCI1945501.1 phosphate butyryltransferase [Clostridium luticellarii]